MPIKRGKFEQPRYEKHADKFTKMAFTGPGLESVANGSGRSNGGGARRAKFVTWMGAQLCCGRGGAEVDEVESSLICAITNRT